MTDLLRRRPAAAATSCDACDASANDKKVLSVIRVTVVI
jgi:hypothetical protein